jgi:hypothetical protein
MYTNFSDFLFLFSWLILKSIDICILFQLRLIKVSVKQFYDYCLGMYNVLGMKYVWSESHLNPSHTMDQPIQFEVLAAAEENSFSLIKYYTIFVNSVTYYCLEKRKNSYMVHSHFCLKVLWRKYFRFFCANSHITISLGFDSQWVNIQVWHIIRVNSYV